MPFAQCNLSTQDEEAESYILKPVGFVTSIVSGVNWWAVNLYCNTKLQCLMAVFQAEILRKITAIHVPSGILKNQPKG